MNSDQPPKIVELVERLVSEDVGWDEIEYFVAEFPGWLGFVERLRYLTQAPHQVLGSIGSTLEYGAVHPKTRRRLLEFLRPFALLLDVRRPPAERVALLQDAGIDVTAFCEEQLYNGSPEIVAAAREVLDVYEIQQTLLRGSSHRDESGKTLLRTSGAHAVPADDLLRPLEGASVDLPISTAGGWLRRLFSRRA